jgi:hypothetical protein
MEVVVTDEKSLAHTEEQAAMTTGESAGPALVLGPMLRYVAETEATIWVETDRECQVEILGRGAPTFEVAGHHYGLVVIDGLAPGSELEYQVALDGTVRWPLPDSGFPPSVLRTLSPGRPARLAFGSCRVAEIALENLDRPARRERVRRQDSAGQGSARQVPERPDTAQPAAPVTSQAQPVAPAGTGGQAGDEGTDALAACAAMLPRCPRDRWPDVLLMIGDQVYADEPGPATRRFIADHRAGQPGTLAPAGEVADFEEYCALYWEAWSDPAVRWLFSVVPTAMIFDDHDVHDDWNISGSWRRDFTARPWWGKRIESAYQSYWVYQHLGNLSPAELARDETWSKVRGQGDAAPVLAELARRADQRAPGIRWSFARTFSTTGGKVRVVMLDSRSRRVVEGARLMADEGEWQWLTGSITGDWEHVVIATSVPPLLPRGIHTLEAWTERICGGAWGRRAARFGEGLRRRFDLEHWPSFGVSFTQLEGLLTSLASGERSAQGAPPATVTLISGDVHHSYLTAVDLPRTATAVTTSTTATTNPPTTTSTAMRASAVYQAVCSPFHQAMPASMRGAQGLASSRLSGLIGTAAATLAGARVPRLKWRITEGPWFDNMIATLTYDGPKAIVRFDRATTEQAGPRLVPVLETDLT